MYNFRTHLDDGEEILWQGQAFPGKGAKNIGGLLFLIIFVLGIQLLMIWSVVTGTGDGANGIDLSFIIIFGVTLLFSGIGIYGIVYNLFLKKKLVADDFYCLTDKRVFKYESNKNKLVYGYLMYYEEIRCDNVENGYGDLYFGIVLEESSDSVQTAAELKSIMANPNPENMPFINFESIEKPASVRNIAKQARKKILDEVENKK